MKQFLRAEAHFNSKNAIGVSEEKYQTDYVAVYKKKVGTNTRGSNSSNNSLHDDTDSIISIHNAKPEVNENEDLAEPNITEYSLSPVDDSGRELTQEQRKKNATQTG